MKRALLIVIAVGVLLLAVGAGVYAVRRYARKSALPPPSAQETMPAGSPAAATPEIETN